MYIDNFQVRLDWRVPLLFLLLLLPVAFFNFALFHTIVEAVVVCIAILAFVVAFNTYPFSRTHYLMFLGCGYFWVGILDFLHALSFPSFGMFESLPEDARVQFWVFARLLEATILLTFTAFIHRPIKRLYMFIWFAIIAGACIALVFSNTLPPLFVRATGFTQLRVWFETLITLMFLLAVWRVYVHRRQFNHSVFILLIWSVGLTILAESMFFIPAENTRFFVNAGHVLKLFSFWTIYIALVESTLTQPFKSLSLSSDTFNAMTDCIVMINAQGQVLHANDAARNFAKADLDGANIDDIHQYFHQSEGAKQDCALCQALRDEQPKCTSELQLGLHWYELSLSKVRYHGRKSVFLHVSRDITERKEALFKFQTADKLYTVLRLTNKAIISSKTKQDLLESVCDIAVNHGGFAMAWIGMVEEDKVIPVSSMGDSTGYLQNIEILLDDPQLGKGPVGLAVMRNSVTFANNIETDPCFAPWSKKALSCGFKSIAAVPVIQAKHCVGVFVIYADTFDAFDPQTLELLSSLSDDISSVLAYIQAEEKRLAAESKLQQLSQAVEQSKNAIMITDIDGYIEYINPFFVELTGYSEQDTLGKNIRRFNRSHAVSEQLEHCIEQVLRGWQWQGEVESIKKSGELFWGMESVSPIVDEQGKVKNVVWVTEDHTELHDANETISQLAYFDDLTGLPNRRLYHDRFTQAINLATRHQTQVAVFYLDLDNFKIVNDSWGHDFGDLLLKHVATTLVNSVRKVDTVARLGGDEFSVIISDIKDHHDIICVADVILEHLNQKTTIDGRELTVASSIGISVYPQDGSDVKTLMKNADMAMYHAKDKGKNNFQFFESFMNINAQQRLEMEGQIQKALDTDAFVLYYQPQFDIHSGELYGVEALIRWPDGNGGFVSPAEFIPVAEESALIIDIGNWVVTQACHEFKSLIDKGLSPVRVAVNISANQFKQSRLLKKVTLDALEASGLPPRLLQLEITEGVLIDNVDETVAVIEQLKRQDINFAIDDFGTGYSSLSYLKSFAVDTIKIDRSFVSDIQNDPNDQAIIRAIIVMAHELDLKVLAEGVENQEQLDFLRQHQCDYVQGFYYAKPMPGAEILTRYGQLDNHGD